MSYKQPAKSNVLDKILPEYKKISEAPTFLDDSQIEYERTIRYKSIDSDGDIYLIANPAAWIRRKDLEKRSIVYRPAPQLIFNAKDAQKAAESKTLSLPNSRAETKELGF
jgi:hypothetical protein